MKRTIMTLAAVLCCTMTMMSQATHMTQEKALKFAEQQAKQADKSPENGKMQYQAAMAFFSDDLGDKKDLDRAMTYAGRALKIAQEHPAPQDTLKGLSCYTLSLIYMAKQSWENCFDFMEMAADGFQEELGRYDPVTMGTKLFFGQFMMGMQPQRAFPMIQEAFNDNMRAPQNKRIENMSEATIVLSMCLENLIELQCETFRYALPIIFKDGKKYFVVQAKDWNVERPLVAWLVADKLRSEEENATHQKYPTILSDDEGNFTILPESEKTQLEYTFKQLLRNPRKMITNEGNSRIFFCQPEIHKQLVERFRAFKAKNNTK